MSFDSIANPNDSTRFISSDGSPEGVAAAISQFDAWIADALSKPYLIVPSRTGRCPELAAVGGPECGRIDHRYIHMDNGVLTTTRSCDEHRLEWLVDDPADSGERVDLP